jgi:hypothetical protein
MANQLKQPSSTIGSFSAGKYGKSISGKDLGDALIDRFMSTMDKRVDNLW